MALGATLALGCWSTVNAGSSFKVVTAPGEARQAQAEAGSSFKVVIAPVDAHEAQAQAPARPQTEEAPPVENTSGVELSNPVPIQQVLLRTGASRLLSFGQPYSKITVSQPSVVDIGPVTNRSAVLKAEKPGGSDVYFFDEKGQLIFNLAVTVDDFVVNRTEALRDTAASPYGTIELHNKSRLDSQTNFRCGADGCHYIGEVTVTEPAPLPSGYTNQTINQPGRRPRAQGGRRRPR